MTYSDELKKEFNYTRTGNGDVTYKSSLNKNLDLFYNAGGVRGNNYYGDKPSYDDYISLFWDAYEENPVLATKNLFNIRDFRTNGKGERDLFRSLVVSLSNENEALVHNLVLSGVFEEFGRFDDLVVLYSNTTSNSVKSAVAHHIKQVLLEDIANMQDDKQVTLLAKWLPTNTRNKNVYSIGKSLAKDLGLTFSDYRKTVSRLRKYLNVLEVNMSSKNYSNIDYSKVPSRAFAKNTAAFYRNDPDNITSFMEKVKSGEVSLKTSGITPDEVVGKFTESSYWSTVLSDLSDEQVEALELTWKELVKNAKDAGNTLVMADVSGSMNGKPMEVSVALAILFAQSSQGQFHNMFMTFSGRPDLINISSHDSLQQIISKVLSADWDNNTDVDAAFSKILSTAVESNSKQEDLPERLVIISDMQFDQSGANNVHIKRWKYKFEQHGYTLPTVVYWNVSASNGVPARADEDGVALVSGFTPATLDAVLTAKDLTPESVMLEALNNEVYNVIDWVYSHYN